MILKKYKVNQNFILTKKYRVPFVDDSHQTNTETVEEFIHQIYHNYVHYW